jgi:hypothetical protein
MMTDKYFSILVNDRIADMVEMSNVESALDLQEMWGYNEFVKVLKKNMAIYVVNHDLIEELTDDQIATFDPIWVG